jgi:hypothetical protein
MSSSRLNLSNKAVITEMSSPFAQGAFRWVAKGNYTSGPRNGQPCVAKWFKSGAVYESTFFEKDIKAVDKAQEIVDAFNEEGVVQETIYLNHPEVWVFVPGSSYEGQRHLIEPFIENFEKFNSNSGYVGGSGGWYQVMQALSHFSYYKTGGQMVLCDLQGGILQGKLRGVVLTDPVILSRSKSYGVTDLGPDGITTFFSRHQCNRYCQDHWHKPRTTGTYFPLTASTTMHLAGFKQQGVVWHLLGLRASTMITMILIMMMTMIDSW